ncbi:Cysteine dioxygenase type I family [Synechococcus sp. PCC 7335]|nr:Cysteine dioxygenase type I family [Synechococcus sp. PCC 7335]
MRLQRLIRQLQEASLLTPAQIKAIVLDANISTEDLLPWADFDHPAADSYGRRLVFHGGHFEIMVMSWVPGDFSAIHDHGATEWGAVQCFGAAEHLIYRLETNSGEAEDIRLAVGYSEGRRLSQPEVAPYSPGMVREVNHSLIHQMGNASDQAFLSLHVYGRLENAQNITGNAKVFDLFEQTIQHTDGGVFFCLPEDQINCRLCGLSAHLETTMMQHRLMRDRIIRIIEAPETTRRQRQFLARKLAVLSTEINAISA